MKKKYETPEVSIVEFEVEDILTTSACIGNIQDNWIVDLDIN